MFAYFTQLDNNKQFGEWFSYMYITNECIVHDGYTVSKVEKNKTENKTQYKEKLNLLLN